MLKRKKKKQLYTVNVCKSNTNYISLKNFSRVNMKSKYLLKWKIVLQSE